MGNSLLERYPLLVRLPPSGPALDQPIAQTDSDVPSEGRYDSGSLSSFGSPARKLAPSFFT